MGRQHKLHLAQLVSLFIDELHVRSERHCILRQRVGIIQFTALDLVKQHCCDNRLPVLYPQSEIGNHVGLRAKSSADSLR